MLYTIITIILLGFLTKFIMSTLRRGKGKKKPSDGGGDQASGTSLEKPPPQEQPVPPSSLAAGEPQPQQGKGKKGKQPQTSRETTPVVEQPAPQTQVPTAVVPSEQETQPGQGRGKGKKGKQPQPQQPSRETTPVVEQPPTPQPQVPAAVPSEPDTQGRGRGKKGKQPQQPSKETTPPVVEQPAPQPQVEQAQPADVSTHPGQSKKKKGKKQQEQAAAPVPVQAAAAVPTPQPQIPQQQQYQGPGRGQTPQQPPAPFPQRQPSQQPPAPFPQRQPSQQPPAQFPQQPPPAWGRGQQLQQPPPQQPQSAWGRGQPPQQAPPPGYGRGQGPQPAARGRGPAAGARGQPPQQQAPPQQAPPPGAGRGQAVPQPRGQQASRGPPRQQQQQPLEQSFQQLQVKDQPPQQKPPPSKGAVQRAPPGAAQKPPPKSSLDLDIPRRSDLRKGGTRGEPFQVETNHLALNINPKLEVAYHYDVAIDPDRPKKLMRVVWGEFHRNYLSRYPLAFDDVRNAYSPQRIPDTAGSVMVAEDPTSRPKEYKVMLKYAADVNLRELFNYMNSGCTTAVPQEALQCIDIVLRNASSIRFVRVGRSYFSPPQGSIVHLGGGLELWHGYFQSAVIGWKPFLNVDVAHKGFPTAQPVVNIFKEMSYRDRGDYLVYDIDKIQKFLKSLKVQYEIPRQPSSRKCYRVNGLVEIPARAMFVINEKPISVYDYFKKEKNYQIQFEQMPCLWVGPRDRKIFLPPELCTIVAGQVINRKLNELQTSNMVRNAATNTDIRKRKIMGSVQGVRYNEDPVVRAFGLQVGSEFERVKARRLAPPNLEYGVKEPVRPFKGQWRAEKFLIPQNLPAGSWTIANLDRRTRDDALWNFVRLLQQNCNQLGMNIEKPEEPFAFMDRFDERQLKQILQKHRSKKLIFIIVPDFPSNVYGKVKRTAEIEIGCLTQCIKSITIGRKMNPATVGNILLKVNAKLNGHNHTIVQDFRPPCLRVPCMIMGADVTHPSPDQTDIPSVAAVTASCDARAFQYNFCWRLQDPRQEIISDLQNIVYEQLMFFYKRTGQKPQRIIFFRDGVSEGQFKEVMNMEVQAIRRACQKVQVDGYQPPITFLVVQKRHHTRFFPTNSRESEDRNMNVRAGTVVDTDITHPTALEYYLVSHASIQGVARPTKYRVLWDDMWNNKQLSEDELEALTYYLCHMFSRCTRSVSYPAPTYYAHLAAFRVRAYIDERHKIDLTALAREQANMEIKQEIIRGLPMFFV